tara:strand:- start:735 stop:968 length:234 start_codon:yes stop_codon:yes gene_type:complete
MENTMYLEVEISKTYQFGPMVTTITTSHNFHDLVDDISLDQYEDAGGENITPQSLCSALSDQTYHHNGINSVTARIK